MKAVKQPIITQQELTKIEKYQKKLKDEGRYSPWTTARRSSSHGQGQILISHKADHEVHLLSLGELGVFLTEEANPNVISIFEQFPLDIAETLKIAEKLNIVHPGVYNKRDRHDGHIPATTMSTDIVTKVRCSDGGIKLCPYYFKYASSFDENITSKAIIRRNIEKLNIEIEYWSTRSGGLRIIDENYFNEIEIYNYTYLRRCYLYPQYIDRNDALYISVIKKLERIFQQDQTITLRKSIENIAQEIGISEFQCECVFKHATLSGYFPIDLSQKIDLWYPLPFEYKVNPYAH